MTGQPLQAHIVYETATPGERVGVVIRQKPSSGTLSAYDTVDLWVARAAHGVVPRVVGMAVPRAQAKLARLKVRVRLLGGLHGRVVAQSPRSGVASAPGMRIVLTVKPAG